MCFSKSHTRRPLPQRKHTWRQTPRVKYIHPENSHTTTYGDTHPLRDTLRNRHMCLGIQLYTYRQTCHMCTHPHQDTHTQGHVRTFIHTWTHTRTPGYTGTCMHTQRHTPTAVRTHTGTHAGLCTYMHRTGAPGHMCGPGYAYTNAAIVKRMLRRADTRQYAIEWAHTPGEPHGSEGRTALGRRPHFPRLPGGPCPGWGGCRDNRPPPDTQHPTAPGPGFHE